MNNNELLVKRFKKIMINFINQYIIYKVINFSIIFIILYMKTILKYIFNFAL